MNKMLEWLRFIFLPTPKKQVQINWVDYIAWHQNEYSYEPTLKQGEVVEFSTYGISNGEEFMILRQKNETVWIPSRFVTLK